MNTVIFFVRHREEFKHCYTPKLQKCSDTLLYISTFATTLKTIDFICTSGYSGVYIKVHVDMTDLLPTMAAGMQGNKTGSPLVVPIFDHPFNSYTGFQLGFYGSLSLFLNNSYCKNKNIQQGNMHHNAQIYFCLRSIKTCMNKSLNNVHVPVNTRVLLLCLTQCCQFRLNMQTVRKLLKNSKEEMTFLGSICF